MKLVIPGQSLNDRARKWPRKKPEAIFGKVVEEEFIASLIISDNPIAKTITLPKCDWSRRDFDFMYKDIKHCGEVKTCIGGRSFTLSKREKKFADYVTTRGLKYILFLFDKTGDNEAMMVGKYNYTKIKHMLVPSHIKEGEWYWNRSDFNMSQ